VPDLLVAGAAVHAGFQLAVSALVYPALADVPPERFAAAHDVHSRRITPLVGAVYLSVLATSAPVVAAMVRGRRPSAREVTAVAAQALSLGTTAFVAAPLHGRLGRLRSDRDLQRLLRADRVRTAAALAGLVAAVSARRPSQRPLHQQH
jgi:hypothetical protein